MRFEEIKYKLKKRWRRWNEWKKGDGKYLKKGKREECRDRIRGIGKRRERERRGGGGGGNREEW